MRFLHRRWARYSVGVAFEVRPRGLGSLLRTTATTVPVTPSTNAPQPVPSRRTDLGCTGVADDHFEGLAEGSERTTSLQIHGGPQGSRTPDLRRAKAALAQLSYRPTRGVSVARPTRASRRTLTAPA